MDASVGAGGQPTPPRTPTARVTVGRYTLEVGAPAGTAIADAEGGPADTARPLQRALREDRERAKEPGPEAPAGADAVVGEASEVTAKIERAVGLFTAVAQGRVDPAALSSEIDALLDLLQRLDRKGRWREALRVARILAALLALLGRWLALVRTLRTALHAAEELGDGAAVGWAQHELGTLHLAAERASGAERRLHQARETRQRIGDRDGLAVTNHNLQALCRLLSQLVSERRLVQRDTLLQKLLRSPALALLAVAALLALAGGAVAMEVGHDHSGPQPTSPTSPISACSDHKDNDGDKLIDGRDPGCADGTEAPANTTAPSECSDGQDNDGDKLIDGRDPGCADGTEAPANTTAPSECSDGQDNDGDKLIDGRDPGCADGTEAPANTTAPSECSDGQDNDGDTLIDGRDPGCADGTEAPANTTAPSECSDGQDNDGDTLIDGRDPGCADGTEAPANTTVG